MKFLRNTKTGQVMHYNRILAKKKIMVPCDAPGRERVKPQFETVTLTPEPDLPPDTVKDPDPPETGPAPPEEKSELLSKTEGEALIKKWFKKTVDKVKVDDLYVYAKEQTGEDFPQKMTKLEIVTKLAAELAVRNA